MRGLMNWDGGRWRAGVWPDVGLAALLTVGGQFELASSGVAGWTGLGSGLLLLVQTAPVAVRRIATATATAIGAGALLIEAVAATPTNTLAGLLAGLVLLYSLGRYVSGTRLVLTTVFTGAALGVHMLRLPGSVLSDLLFAAVFSAAAWLAGRTMRRREVERRRAEADARAEQLAAAAAVDAAVAEERRRISRELHDVVAHGMGIMVVQAAAAEQLLQTDPHAAREPLTTVREVGQGALAEMRRLLGLLRDGGAGEAEEPQPGLGRMPDLVERLRQAGMAVTVDVTGKPTELPPGLQLCAYRILQEALTNVLKHAGGAVTLVSLDYGSESLVLRVHNAAGRPSTELARSGAGHGLVGMRERVRLYGGTLTAAVQDDGSFLVEATLPTRA